MLRRIVGRHLDLLDTRDSLIQRVSRGRAWGDPCESSATAPSLTLSSRWYYASHPIHRLNKGAWDDAHAVGAGGWFAGFLIKVDQDLLDYLGVPLLVHRSAKHSPYHYYRPCFIPPWSCAGYPSPSKERATSASARLVGRQYAVR